MRSRRFDKQLQSVFMVLSGLMVVVGLASFGVNRFLAQTQKRVLSESIAIIERTERVAQDADFAASLAGRLAEARTVTQVAETTQALDGRVDSIAADLDAMRLFLGGRTDPGSADAVRRLVGRMRQSVDLLVGVEAALQADRALLVEAGSRLAMIISTETDLARLRVTAGIWELYAQPRGADSRPGLDRLADVNFFAYERLAEMAEANAALERLVARIPGIREPAGLAGLEAEFETALNLARDRSQFMLSETSRREAGLQLQRLSAGLGPEGLVARRKAALSAQRDLGRLAAQLDRELDLLIAEARLGRDETRARMKQGVASAGGQAALLSAALAAVIVLALLAGYLLWTRTRRKVVLRLEEVAERMVAVAGGDIGQPMQISGQDEIGKLEEALNILRCRTEEAAELRNRLEAAVLARTADVVAEMQSANAARADAEEQSRAKMHFLARMSHEIRTPLNGLIGILDLLASEERDATRRARLDVALTSARDLQSMTEDILTFSVGEEGRERSRSEAFDPAALARGLGEYLRVMAAAKGLATTVEISTGLPAAVMGEPTKIRQVVTNLLSNAVKYTAQGRVGLAVTARSAGAGRHEIGFAVRDTGPGMTAEETRQAFDIYGRSVTARRSGIRGVGLGLAIVRQLTDAMGGELRVSTAPGQGSSFTLVLRLPQVDAAQIAPPPALAVQGGSRRVLVVDDHPVNRLVARGYLERMGCEVTEAATGAEALDAAARGRFDAIFVDLGLPDLAGEEVVARIRRDGALVAVLTAELVQDDAATRARFGVDRVLTKPVSPRALAAFLFAEEASVAPIQDPAASEVDAAVREDVASLGAAQATEIVAALLDDLAVAVPRLRAATDPEARRKLAHRLKGAASNFRLSALCALLRRIEAGDSAAVDRLEPIAAEAARSLVAAAEAAGLRVQAGWSGPGDTGAAKQ
ncbi:ATP-binding protein [Paracoccus solventivorans]|nr:ATP-binding protein [Paracoccus solventivorans]